MFQLLKVYLLTLPIYLGIDMFWILVASKKFYDSEFVHFARTLRIVPTILVYLLIPLAILIFVVPKAHGNLLLGLLYGALLGLAMYGVYDLTNHAVFTYFSWKVTIVDILWGMTVSGIIGALMTYLTKIIK